MIHHYWRCIVKNDNINLGESGEDQAAFYLKNKGYTIVESNYKTVFGEIDIIAQDKKTIVFVEVKTKSNSSFGLPEEMVTQKKKEHLIRTVQWYLKENKYLGKARIDVIAIDDEIRHIENAVEFPII